MPDRVTVGVRIRPLNARELATPNVYSVWRTSAQSATITSISPTPSSSSYSSHSHTPSSSSSVTATSFTNSITNSNNHNHSFQFPPHPQQPTTIPCKFRFDAVFDEAASNAHVYATLCAPLVRAVQNGLSHATVFAYGQTSSGKTHTMVGNADDPGVTARAIADVFSSSSSSSSTTHDDHPTQPHPQQPEEISASYVEIYNERIRDLLNPAEDLVLRDDGAGRVHLVGVTQVLVRSKGEALGVLQRGQAQRRVAGTRMNAASSRSHTIFTLRFLRTGSELTLVDLAGSERASHSDGLRLQEGSHINQSLLVLGSIISRLSSTSSNKKQPNTMHLPFRDSKLTRLLRPALSGSGRTVVLCNITPAITFFDESLSTLKFARRAKLLPVKPNEPLPQSSAAVDYRAKYDRVSEEVSILRQRFKALEQEVLMLRAAAGITSPTSSHPSTSTATATSSVSVSAAMTVTSTSTHTPTTTAPSFNAAFPTSSTLSSRRADRSPRMSLCSSSTETETEIDLGDFQDDISEGTASTTVLGDDDFDDDEVQAGAVRDVDDDGRVCGVSVGPESEQDEVQALRSRISFVERENKRLKNRLLDMASKYKAMRLQATKLQSSVRIHKRNKHARNDSKHAFDYLRDHDEQVREAMEATTNINTSNTSLSFNIHQHNHYHHHGTDTDTDTDSDEGNDVKNVDHQQHTENVSPSRSQVIQRITMSSAAATSASTCTIDPAVGSATALALHLGDLFTMREREQTNLGIATVQQLQQRRAEEHTDDNGNENDDAGLLKSMVMMVKNLFQTFGR